MVSREAAFLYNNLVLCGIAFAVLWGTLFPIISEAVTGHKITVEKPFFDRVNIPLGLFLLALTGIGPLIAWRRASVSNLKRQFAVPAATGLAVGALLVALGMRSFEPVVAYTLCGFVAATILQEFYKGIGARRSIHGEGLVQGFLHLVGRNRRRYGGYIVHAGIVMLFAAFAGGAFRQDHDFTLRTTGEATATDPFGHQWRFQSEGLSTNQYSNRATKSVSLSVWRDGKPVRAMRSEKRQYLDSQGNPQFEPSTVVDILSSAQVDTYLVFTGDIPNSPNGAFSSDSRAEIRVSFIPLVMWVWVGGVTMMIGGLIVMWPQAERRRAQSGYVTVIPSREPAQEPVLV
jgi:cytochrome c-type biogenesis protein CcmF